MWTRERLETRLADSQLEGRLWGRTGREVADRLEQELNLSLPLELRSFAETIGNLMVDPFSVIVTGDERGRMSCITETRATPSPPGIKVMDHAGEAYFVTSPTGRVEAYDAAHLATRHRTLTFDSLTAFLEWLLVRAEVFQRSTSEFQ